MQIERWKEQTRLAGESYLDVPAQQRLEEIIQV